MEARMSWMLRSWGWRGWEPGFGVGETVSGWDEFFSPRYEVGGCVGEVLVGLRRGLSGTGGGMGESGGEQICRMDCHVGSS
jgi:hypothetical protein